MRVLRSRAILRSEIRLYRLVLPFRFIPFLKEPLSLVQKLSGILREYTILFERAYLLEKPWMILDRSIKDALHEILSGIRVGHFNKHKVL